MRLLWTWPFLLACSAKNLPPCQEWTEAEDGQGVIFEVRRPDGPNIEIEAVIPLEARTNQGAPTAVFVHGGWGPVQTPLDERSPMLRTDMGFTSLYPNLGRTDVRGATSRSILSRVLQYANGDIADTDGCSLDERIPDGRAPEIVLAGFSNGGNLSWATAGDPALNIPRIDGIATFETPISSQLIAGETGTQRVPNPRFSADLCSFNDLGSLQCSIDYSPLLAKPPSECSEHNHCLFIDLDESGEFSDGDLTLGGVWDPQTEVIVYSAAATQAAEQAGILPDESATFDTAVRFWSHREAPQSMPSAVERFPEIAGISTGTEVDHVLDDLERPIHVTGMIEAMNNSGVVWNRLHADPKFLDEIHGSAAEWIDFPPNSPVQIDDHEWWMEPEDGPSIRGTDYLSAAVAELLDRSRTGDWSTAP